MSCKYKDQPRVCVMKLTMHHRGTASHQTCVLCEHGAKAWKAAKSTETKQEDSDMPRRGQCVKCKEGPYRLNGRSLCANCAAEERGKGKPTSPKPHSDKKTKPVSKPKEKPATPPAPSGVVKFEPTKAKRLQKTITRDGQPILAVRNNARGKTFAVNADAVRDFNIGQAGYVDFYSGDGVLFLRFTERQTDRDSYKLADLHKSNRIINAATVINTVGIAPGKYELQRTDTDGVFCVEFVPAREVA
jgi:hypothetical protein